MHHYVAEGLAKALRKRGFYAAIQTDYNHRFDDTTTAILTDADPVIVGFAFAEYHLANEAENERQYLRFVLEELNNSEIKLDMVIQPPGRIFF